MRIQNPQTGQGSSTGYNTLIAAWQTPAPYDLPTGTAYQWETSTVIDYNHHYFNPDNTRIMAVDVYVNVFTQPKGTAQDIMYSDLIQYGGNLYIPNNSQNIGFQQSDYDAGATNYMNIWLLATHTHKYGIDYDIYLRNANNTMGQQIYEGFYNTDYTFNQGYYDWAHPAVRRFEPTMLQVDPRLGLIQQATFNNYGPSPVTFGLTTNDEMMLYYMQYTWGGPLSSSVNEHHSASEISLGAFPNPFADKTNITYELKQNSAVTIEVFDVVGSKIASLVNNESQSAGKHQVSLDAIGGTAGVYFVKVLVDGVGYMQHVVQTK
jgi:hypothetical protein